MEAAVRWSSLSTPDHARFMIADVAGNCLSYCRVTSSGSKHLTYESVWKRVKLPNFNAFDWSKSDENVVAIGTELGEARVMRIDSSSDTDQSFCLRLQRKCNSVAFNVSNRLAAGLDKARNDPSSLRLYDVERGDANILSEAGRRINVSDAVTNVKFFADQPDVLLCGVARKCLSLYDVRDPSTTTAISFLTRNVHFLSIDPLDENYFASAGPSGSNIVTVWDRRVVSQGTAANLSSTVQTAPVLEVNPAVSDDASIWSLRYSGYQRGTFGVLSSKGQLRLFETSSFTSSNALGMDGLPETTYYIKTSRDIAQASDHKVDDISAPSSKLLAFDFARSGCLIREESILCLRQDRSAEAIAVAPASRSLAHSNARSLPSHKNRYHEIDPFLVAGNTVDQWSAELKREAMGVVPHGAERGSLAAVKPEAGGDSTMLESSITGLPSGSKQMTRDAHMQDRSGFRPETSTQSVVAGLWHRNYARSQAYGKSATMPSRERHARFVEKSQESSSNQNLDEQRCRNGYLLDCVRNKHVVQEDPWLVELWDVIKRLEEMAHEQGMVYDALDLSYLGIHDIWFEQIGNIQARLVRRNTGNIPEIRAAITGLASRKFTGSFEGANTAHPAHRQLALAITGWLFEPSELTIKCKEIVSRGEYYKGILVAFCHGSRDVALDLLRELVRARKLENSGLAAIIAFDTATPEQRELCRWMADEADDPYHKALLSYFVTGDWQTVVQMAELPLLYRVAVALKYLGDAQLSAFLKEQTAEAIAYGDTEGIVLTGLTESSMTLFQSYIARFNDLQTAVLATALAVPQYVSDPRWLMWKETYFEAQQRWRTFIERTRFTVLHNRRAARRKGQVLRSPAAQVTLRCMHCQKSIAKREPELQDDVVSTTASTITRIKSTTQAGTITCPQCSANLVRCCICMEWLGSADPASPVVAEMLAERDLLGSMINFCMVCNHASHPDHARDWFASNSECPVPHCSCQCMA